MHFFSSTRWRKGAQLDDGLEGGPLVLFDKTGQALVISAFNAFMASSLELKNQVVSWGIMGDVNTVPAGFECQTIMYYSPDGINKVK